MNVGVFIPNWVGDVAMCTPTLRALRRRFDGARLVGIMRPYVADVLAGTPWLDEQIFFHQSSPDAAQRGWAVVRTLRRRKFEMIVLLTNSFPTALLARLSGARTRVGYVRHGRGLLLTHKLYDPRIGRRRLPMPQIDSYLQIAYALGCDLEQRRLELATLARDETAADAVWQKWNLPPGDRVVVLNSSGAYGGAKLWPSEHFAALARRIVTTGDLAVLVTCGPPERDTAREIVRRADHPRVVSLADQRLSIGLTKACIRRSRAMVTTDSGPRFFAVAFGVPVITLFGPTDVAWTRSHWGGEICLSEPVPCGPCGRRTCPLSHHQCMRSLSVERVFAALEEQLARGRDAQAA